MQWAAGGLWSESGLITTLMTLGDDKVYRVWPWHGVGKDDEVQEVMGLGAHAGSGLCRRQEDAVL